MGPFTTSILPIKVKEASKILAILLVMCAFVGIATGQNPDSFPSNPDSRDVPWLNEVTLDPSINLVRHAPQHLHSIRAESADEWLAERASLLSSWEDFLGAFPHNTNVKKQGDFKTVSPKVDVIESKDFKTELRLSLIRYETEPGELVEAYLLEPKRCTTKCPGVVVFHSTVDTTIDQPIGLDAGLEDKAYAYHLAKLGCVALCPRNFLWKPNTKFDGVEQVRQFRVRNANRKGMARMLLDAVVAVDVLSSLPNVDAERLGAVGHSLGAKEVLYLAAWDERIRAAVSSEGGVGIEQSNWDAEWYLGPSVRDENFSLQHDTLVAAVVPRPFLLIGGESADGDASAGYLRTASQVSRFFPGPVRLGLFNHRQGHSVPKISMERTLEWIRVYLRADSIQP